MRYLAIVLILVLLTPSTLAASDIIKSGVIEVNATGVDILGYLQTSSVTRISATGVGTFASGTTVNSQNVCLADGTNCPTTYTGTDALADTNNRSGWLNSTRQVWLANNATNVSVGSTPTLFVDNTNGRVGIGDSRTQHIFQVNGTETSASTSTLWEGKLEYRVVPTAGSAGDRRALEAYAYAPISSTNNLSRLVGFQGSSENYGSGNITTIAGVEGWAYNANDTTSTGRIYGINALSENEAGTIGSIYALRAWSGINGGIVTSQYGLRVDLENGGGTLTNQYGVYLSADAGATNNYGIYQATSGQVNYFAGNVGIGTTTPEKTLAVIDASSPGDRSTLQIGRSYIGNSYTADNNWDMLYISSRAYYDATTTNWTIKGNDGNNDWAAITFGGAGPHIRFLGKSETGSSDVNYTEAGFYANTLMLLDDGGTLRIGTGTPGNATGAGDLYVTSDIEYDANLYGPGADLAELIHAAEPLEAGDVVEADGNVDETVRKSRTSYNTRVIGVISTKPGIILSKNDGDVPLAISGRVPVKATAENGPIARGDLLTTSSTPGKAMRCDDIDACRGALIGKSLGTLSTGEGTIPMIVLLG